MWERMRTAEGSIGHCIRAPDFPWVRSTMDFYAAHWKRRGALLGVSLVCSKVYEHCRGNLLSSTGEGKNNGRKRLISTWFGFVRTSVQMTIMHQSIFYEYGPWQRTVHMGGAWQRRTIRLISKKLQKSLKKKKKIWIRCQWWKVPGHRYHDMIPRRKQGAFSLP